MQPQIQHPARGVYRENGTEMSQADVNLQTEQLPQPAEISNVGELSSAMGVTNHFPSPSPPMIPGQPPKTKNDAGVPYRPAAASISTDTKRVKRHYGARISNIKGSHKKGGTSYESGGGDSQGESADVPNASNGFRFQRGSPSGRTAKQLDALLTPIAEPVINLERWDMKLSYKRFGDRPRRGLAMTLVRKAERDSELYDYDSDEPWEDYYSDEDADSDQTE